VIGISGGLDSTHALIVAAKAMDQLGRPRSDILAYTLPGFATSDRTKSNAWKLMRAMGVTAEEIDIRPAAQQMLADLGHPFAKGEPVYDVTFENVQAGLRTDYLFRLANHHKGMVVGTGDLSELALGWCTYGVGDQMSHYNPNGGVPKTLIQHLIRFVASPRATSTRRPAACWRTSWPPRSRRSWCRARPGPGHRELRGPLRPAGLQPLLPDPLRHGAVQDRLPGLDRLA
jgi:NAD+ synthetase